MERRSLLKIAALTALSQKFPVLGQMPMAHPQLPDSPYTLQFFTEEESRQLDEWMEMILPADNHSPGAHEAKTNLFADHMVATSSEAVRQSWREGLRLMNEQASRSNPEAALRTAAANEAQPATPLEHFFVTLKQMTVQGYYTSSIGIHQEMEYVGNTYVAAFPECAHTEHGEESAIPQISSGKGVDLKTSAE